jgi:hypothetical protein
MVQDYSCRTFVSYSFARAARLIQDKLVGLHRGSQGTHALQAIREVETLTMALVGEASERIKLVCLPEPLQ